MNRTRIYIFSLIGFFLMWGVFGFAAAAPRGEPSLRRTVLPIETTPVVPDATDSVGIPVTGQSEPVWTEILGFYGFIGLAALFLILALLNFANKATAPYKRHKGPPFDETHKN